MEIFDLVLYNDSAAKPSREFCNSRGDWPINFVDSLNYHFIGLKSLLAYLGLFPWVRIKGL